MNKKTILTRATRLLFVIALGAFAFTLHAQSMVGLDDELQTLIRSGRLADAIDISKARVQRAEESHGKSHPSFTVALNQLARVLTQGGKLPEASAAAEQSLAIRESLSPAQPNLVAVSLDTLATIRSTQGNPSAAASLFQRAIEIREKLNPEPGIELAYSLAGLANSLRAMGKLQEALPLASKARLQAEAARGQDHADVAAFLRGEGNVYYLMGRFGEALPLYVRGLQIAEAKLGPETIEAVSFHASIGNCHVSLGNWEAALPMFNKTVTISEKVRGVDHIDTARALGLLANTLKYLNRHQEASVHYARALAIRETKLGADHPDTLALSGHFAESLKKIGELDRALVIAQRVVAGTEKRLGPLHHEVSYWSEVVASIHRDKGEINEALKHNARAYQIAMSIPPTGGLRPEIKVSFALTAHKSGDTELAIFLGKEAVNDMQQYRLANQTVGKDLQRTLLKSNEHIYTTLTDWLITAGRLAEAQEVLAMLKEDELYQLLRGGDTIGNSTVASFVGPEKEWTQRLSTLGLRTATLGRELSTLKRSGVGGDQNRIREIETQLETSSREFESGLASLLKAFRAEGDKRRLSSRIDQIEGMRETLAELGEGVVLIHLVPTGERLHIMLTTPEIRLARTGDVKEPQLNALVAAMRQAVQTPAGRYLPASQKLYQAIIRPIERDLEEVGAKTLMLSLNGTLRYLPFAALHDGKKYLVEKYNLAVYTDASATNLAKRPSGDWRVWGLGVTKSHPGFSDLPNVELELKQIVSTVPGEFFLDEQFTEERLREGVMRRFPVLHIASHFKFTPGTETDSFLLIGSGQPLTMDRIRHGPRFDGVDLLTLSACESGFGGGKDQLGREIEGLGALAQTKGARGVLATLWQVADESTATFMHNFYQRKGQKRETSKAEALRQTQLQFLTRKVADKGDYAHPFFWAPFILMGNWQ